MSKKKLNITDALTISSDVMPLGYTNNERDLAGELYNKNWAGKAMDQYEKQVLGLASAATKKKNLKYKSRVFHLEFEKDTALFDELMNNPKFTIVSHKDNWGMDGKYAMFVIYAEDLDYKSPEDIKKIAEQNNS